MITAVVMVGEKDGASDAATWVQGARRAAACDLIAQLRRQSSVGRVVLASVEPLDAPVDAFVRTNPGLLHVGEQLAQLVRDHGITRLFYVGGGAAPLLSDKEMAQALQWLGRSERAVVTNNRFASDWAGVVPAAALAKLADKLPRDNMLGWVLSTDGGLPVHVTPETTATRLDIDTPSDLMALRLHPSTKPKLRRYLAALELPLDPLRKALAVLATPASRTLVSGRVGPTAWSRLNATTRSWIRVFAEERGMLSSGRQAKGEVFSLVADYLEQVGIESFFSSLTLWADTAFIDTRVLLAHRKSWPGAADRFASDLGRTDEIEDEWLRRFTAAAQAAPVPVVLGGHGLLSGNMLAFCDILEGFAGYQQP